MKTIGLQAIACGRNRLTDLRAAPACVIGFQNYFDGVGRPSVLISQVQKSGEHELGVLFRVIFVFEGRGAEINVVQVYVKLLSSGFEPLFDRQNHGVNRIIQTSEMKPGGIDHKRIIVVVDDLVPVFFHSSREIWPLKYWVK